MSIGIAEHVYQFFNAYWMYKQYIQSGYFSVNAPPELYIVCHGKIAVQYHKEIDKQSKNKSLRELARQYGVNYETVRRVIKAVK